MCFHIKSIKLILHRRSSHSWRTRRSRGSLNSLLSNESRRARGSSVTIRSNGPWYTRFTSFTWLALCKYQINCKSYDISSSIWTLYSSSNTPCQTSTTVPQTQVTPMCRKPEDPQQQSVSMKIWNNVWCHKLCEWILGVRVSVPTEMPLTSCYIHIFYPVLLQ